MKQEKKEIKAIFFDIGGVLYNESVSSKNKKNFEKKFEIPFSSYQKVVWKYVPSAQENKISMDTYFQRISNKLKLNKKDLMDNYKKTRKKSLNLNKDVENTLIKLKKNYLLGTLTNIISINHRLRLKKKVYKHFKIKLISCKEGLRKPDVRFYKLMIQRSKVSPKQIIFIDDEEKLLLPAKQLGINTILFKTNKQLIQDLKKLGVKI